MAETLGTDADTTAEALSKVSEEMFDEALESKLQDAIDDGAHHRGTGTGNPRQCGFIRRMARLRIWSQRR